MKFQVGDEVWTPAEGNGTIVKINKKTTNTARHNYLLVEFETGAKTTFTKEGRHYASDKNPTLFFRGTTINPAPKPSREYVPESGETCYIISMYSSSGEGFIEKICYIDDDFFVIRIGGGEPGVYERSEHSFAKLPSQE